MNYKIITPVATEPVTLAEAKLHLRLTSDSFAGDIATIQSIPPGEHPTAASFSLIGAAVDVLGAISLVNLSVGTCGSGGNITAKIQESDDNINWQDNDVFTTVTEDNDNSVQEIEYTGGKQYIRVAATVSVSSCSFGADVIIKSGDATEDSLLSMLISTAREYCENYTGRALSTQTIEGYLDRFPCVNEIALPKSPIQSVTSVKYKDFYGTETTMEAETEYIVDTDSEIGRIVLPYGLSWPSFNPFPVNPIKIRYIAGYSSINPVPKSIKLAMLLLIGHWYVNREAVGEVGGQLEFAVKALLSMYRTRWF